MPQAKYTAVGRIIRGEIASGKLAHGDRIPSIREICAAYDVSAKVALRVFRELSEENLIGKRDGEGYYVLPPGGMQKSSRIVCAFRPLCATNRKDNFGNRMLYGIMGMAFSNHKDVVFPESCMRLLNSSPSEQDIATIADEVFAYDGIAGIILDMRIPDESIRRYFLPRAGTHGVAVAGRSSNAAIKSSRIPMAEIGADVAKLAMRSSAVSFLMLPTSPLVFNDTKVLEKAFVENLETEPANMEVLSGFTAVSREQDRVIADAAARRIKAAKGKTFVFCGTDHMAYYFYELMTERGFAVVKDYFLIGFGGFDIMENFPPRIATVALDQAAIGGAAVELALGSSMRRFADAPYTIKFNETF